MGKRLFFLFFILFVFSDTVLPGNLPAPRFYGEVIIRNHSRESGLAPVVFDHWLHRAKYTCRLCHVDIGFAMESGATGISADTNMQGYYCGACHDGKRKIGFKKIFKACSEDVSGDEKKRCERCHSQGKKVRREYEFDTFAEKMPRLMPGKLIDWETAEAKGLIKPIDFLEGISIKRDSLKAQADFSIVPKVGWVTDVIFSHKKHAVWNGCEVCHPDIFPSTKKGTVKYTMFDIASGKYCGACHTNVAFPFFLCHKCHANPVR
jgi:c(7)-type cytochrome triheme protein